MRCLAMLAVLTSGAAAHELGTTRVTAEFRPDRTYEITVVTDGAALAEKLETLAGRSVEPGAPPSRLRAILEHAEPLYRERVKIAFDSSPSQPAIAYSVSAAEGPGAACLAMIRFTGRVPESAREFEWSYAWTFATYPLTFRMPGGEVSTVWLDGGRASTKAVLGDPGSSGPGSTLWRYAALGFTHILPHGLDHVLFVLGIYLLSGRTRSVLLQVSAFTAAHSITLGLTMYRLVAVPASVVEPLIAVSIAYVAVENIFLTELKSRRLALVFAFGLLHGMGFAGALAETGMPRAEFAAALLAFNLGVEAGQLAIIGLAFLAVGWRFSAEHWYRRWVAIPASAAIACVAVYWTLERIVLY